MTEEIRSTTLAAEILEQVPQLRQAAQGSDEFARLTGTTPQVKLDDGRTFHLLEGDLLYDEDEFLIYSLQQARSGDNALMSLSTNAIIEPPPALIGISRGKKLIRWAPDVVLRYCVIRSSFPQQDQYEKARDSVAAAAAAWEGVCGITFQYMPEHDGHPDPSTPANEINPSLVFSVRYVDAQGQFIAAAFFPTYPPARRRVLIDPSYFSGGLSFDQVGVLRHELGHVLGFRHEHISSGAPAVCPNEDNKDTIDLTAYDPKSVMHYFCGGVGSRELRITDLDREGAQKLYGPPWANVELLR
ncbi:hypothetical protein JIG36_40475 [Actinoplanes sp. LDG1-06]|uniref:Peptidase metallopeptidase domain-containing protein n=1 Tax=Paractinoplanes ovalisporus TaxID=2810368 RepID=A0ABS2ARL1_9ACTN|nr:hypothetical protein [Actinoplanes ovalisporus]MBM2621799.1 hypothetical protein [Actinoplanes ovalisporus]